jgi:hypothetical protein
VRELCAERHGDERAAELDQCRAASTSCDS